MLTFLQLYNLHLVGLRVCAHFVSVFISSYSLLSTLSLMLKVPAILVQHRWYI